MKPLTEREINDFEPCLDSDCNDDVCAFSRQLMEARVEEEALRLKMCEGFAETATAERDAAIEDRNRGDCRTNNGWLAEGLECEIDGDPSCFYHYWQQAEDREKTLREALKKSRWMVALLGRRYVKGEDEGGCMTCDRWVDTEGHSESCEYAAMVTFMKSARAALEGE